MASARHPEARRQARTAAGRSAGRASGGVAGRRGAGAALSTEHCRSRCALPLRPQRQRPAAARAERHGPAEERAYLAIRQLCAQATAGLLACLGWQWYLRRDQAGSRRHAAQRSAALSTEHYHCRCALPLRPQRQRPAAARAERHGPAEERAYLAIRQLCAQATAFEQQRWQRTGWAPRCLQLRNGEVRPRSKDAGRQRDVPEAARLAARTTPLLCPPLPFSTPARMLAVVLPILSARTCLTLSIITLTNDLANDSVLTYALR